MEFEPMLTPREKSPLPKMSPEEDRTRDTSPSTTNWAIPAPVLLFQNTPFSMHEQLGFWSSEVHSYVDFAIVDTKRYIICYPPDENESEWTSGHLYIFAFSGKIFSTLLNDEKYFLIKEIEPKMRAYEFCTSLIHCFEKYVWNV